MSSTTVDARFNVELARAEFRLICAALSGRLSGPEIQEAKILNLKLVRQAEQKLREAADFFEHAVTSAEKAVLEGDDTTHGPKAAP